MKKRTLQVALHARESSVIELTVGERVQLDRLTATPHGCIAERYGALLEPGLNTLALGEGHYFFKTLSDAHLCVVRGGVDPTPAADDKDGDWPDPQKVTARGDDAHGELPRLTVG